jgi:hypothetical protein
MTSFAIPGQTEPIDQPPLNRYDVARYQKWAVLVFCVTSPLLALAVYPFGWPALVLFSFWNGPTLFHLAKALKIQPRWVGIVFPAVPVANIVLLGALAAIAGIELSRVGIHVGWLGVSLKDLRGLKPHVPRTAKSDSSPTDRLRVLAGLRQDSLISEADYQLLKQRILAEI